MTAGPQKDQAMVRSLEFSTLSPIPLRRQKGKNGVNDQSQAYVMKPLQKNKSMRLGELPDGAHIQYREGDTP